MLIVAEENFCPILYIMPFKDIDEAIKFNNSVRYGLSSSIFTDNIQNAEKFLSSLGSDCGIANVNISTSGAEIGGAFRGKSILVAVVKLVQMRGRHICDVKLALLIMVRIYR